ncbi:MAG: DUF2442 domain-containing protein [Proteobacteria bacterium]|nr:DUF2442 domain-containing protein [Pseudomonadota bacterium]
MAFRSVVVLPDYCLSVTCNDGVTGIVDMSQLIFSEKAGIYSALKDVQLFNQVRIELGVLTWPNGADIDPAWLYEESALLLADKSDLNRTEEKLIPDW